MPDHETVLVLNAETAVAEVSARFRTLGWDSVQGLPPLAQQPSGDRVIAEWQGPSEARAYVVDDGIITTLHVRGSATAAQALASSLACRQPAAVLNALGSRDVRTLIAAVRAAAVLGDATLVAGLASLQHHPDELVRVEAAAALQRMLPALVAQGTALVRTAAQESGGANPLWPTELPRRDRRQMLRWLIRDGAGRMGLRATLLAAFADPDWEVQAGAVIATVRHGMRELGSAVKQWNPPTISRDGATADDRALLRALRDVALVALAGITPPAAAGERAVQRSATWDQLSRCLMGDLSALRDHAWLVVRSLSEPVEEPDSMPETRAGWCVVPAVAHWLGDVHRDAEAIRSVTGPVVWVQQEPQRTADGWWTGTWEDAQHYAGAAGAAILTADAWECAARGSDGRCFPWGAGFDADAALALSPWGCSGYAQGWEWVLGIDGPELRGGAKPVPCWLRRRPEPGERARLRLCRLE